MTITATRNAAPATEKQLGFLARLIAENSGYAAEEAIDLEGPVGGWTKRSISGAIDALLVAGRERRAAERRVDDARPEPPIGFHYVDGVVYRLKRSATSGKLYAMAMNERLGWDYVGRRPFDRVSSETYLTIEQAAKMSAYHGRCVICGKQMHVRSSVERGIGPVCAARLGAQ